MRGRHRELALLLVTAGCFLGVTGPQAEVGVYTPSGSTEIRPNGPWVFNIVDEPDPFGGGAWKRVSPAGAPGRSILNEQGSQNRDGRPALLFNRVSGLPIVAWSKNTPDGYDIVVSHFAENAWADPLVLADSAFDELDPALTLDPSDGTVHLFYWVDDSTPRVMHRAAPADLSSWSAPVQVSDPADCAYRPRAVVHGDVLRVAYEVHDFGPGQTPRNIVLALRDPQTGEFIEEVMAVSNHDGLLWPRPHSHKGRLWVDWIDSNSEIAWIRKDLQGQWEPTRYESYSSVEERDWLVRGGIRVQAVTLP